ncbi:MAG TPA: TROVE domain-containing protein, partial [Nitrososphaeraceae archaeon]|nr:TROVE domain-containing protein [Nitrososphaeraceae archaeon]
MGKFNKTKEPVRPTEINEMGEKSYKLEAKEELVSTCLTTFLQSSYYETENEIVSRILKAANSIDPEFVAKLAIYLRDEANMRSVSHLLAGDLVPRISGEDYAKRFYEKISIRPDDMSEILAYYFAKKAKKNSKGNYKIPNAIKKGFRNKLESMDAYLIDKYKMKNRDISLIDLVNLFRPKPNQRNEEAFRRLINGESLDGLYSTKILEKEMSKAGQKAKIEDVNVDNLKEEAIENVLGNIKGMPIFNLVRNLRNILLLAPDSVDEACKQLTIKDKILKSRLLPFRFASAYTEIEKLTSSESAKTSKSSIVFESETKVKGQISKNFSSLKQQILNALEIAIAYSVENIPELEGNTAILVDHSGSVRGDGGGSSLVSAFSKTTTAIIGNLFASMLAYKQKDVYIGLFGDKLIQVPVDRNMGVLKFNQHSYNVGGRCGGGTEHGIYDFLRQVIK